MRSLRHLCLPLTLASALLSPCTASADAIRISSGFAELTGAYDLSSAERGFRLTGVGYGGGSSPSIHVFCVSDACTPGSAAQLREAFGGLDLIVTSAMLDGVTYTDVNTTSSVAFAEVGFSSTHVLPASSASATLRTPFAMEGAFSHPGTVETLTGSGIVTTRWVSERAGESDTPTWRLEAARYDFADPSAVPEPGTMVLVGLGCAGVMMRRRSRTGAPPKQIAS